MGGKGLVMGDIVFGRSDGRVRLASSSHPAIGPYGQLVRHCKVRASCIWRAEGIVRCPLMVRGSRG